LTKLDVAVQCICKLYTYAMTQLATSQKTKLTILLPKSKWIKIKQFIPRGDYSKFFEFSAERELERLAKQKLLGLKGKLEFDLDWPEMEALELKMETK